MVGPAVEGHTAEIRKYLIDKGVAPLLEQFMAEVIATRPDDVLGFLKQWATEKHALAVGVSEAAAEAAGGNGNDNEEVTESGSPVTAEPSIVDLRDPLEVVSAAWKKHIQETQLQKAVMESFFQNLFVQKPIFKRTIFADVDVASMVDIAAPVVDKAFTGALHDSELIGFCKEVAIGKGLEEKHFASFLTAMHAAVASKIPTAEWEDMNIPWNKYLRELSIRAEMAIAEADQIFKVESTHNVAEAAEPDIGSDDDDSAEAKKDENRSPAELVRDSWVKLPEAQQLQALTNTFELLFVQHPILKKVSLSDLEVPALVELLRPVVDAVVEGSVNAEKAKATAFVQQADQRGLKPKHIDYLITSLLASLSKQFGQRWKALNDAWGAALTAAGKVYVAVAFPAQQE